MRLTVILVTLWSGGLTEVFINGGEQTVAAYIMYVVSFYTLRVVRLAEELLKQRSPLVSNSC